MQIPSVWQVASHVPGRAGAIILGLVLLAGVAEKAGLPPEVVHPVFAALGLLTLLLAFVGIYHLRRRNGYPTGIVKLIMLAVLMLGLAVIVRLIV